MTSEEYRKHIKNKMENSIDTGIILIAKERQHQIIDKGYDIAKDSTLGEDDLTNAAISYLMLNTKNIKDAIDYFPWSEDKNLKPKDKISNLITAGALIAAEIDKMINNERIIFIDGNKYCIEEHTGKKYDTCNKCVLKKTCDKSENILCAPYDLKDNEYFNKCLH